MIKIELATIVKVNHYTAQKWSMAYFEKGIDGLLFDGRIGFKQSIINSEIHQAIDQRLTSLEDAFTSYVDLINSLLRITFLEVLIFTNLTNK